MLDKSRSASTQVEILINIETNNMIFWDTSIVNAANIMNGSAIRYLLKICLMGMDENDINAAIKIKPRIRVIISLNRAIKTTKTNIPTILIRVSKL